MKLQKAPRFGAQKAIFFCNALCLEALLLGCSATPPVTNAPMEVPGIEGKVRGGNQTVAGSTVQLFTAGLTGYASASTAVSAPSLTDNGGNFTIPQPLTCPSGSSLVYLTARGGNPGLGSGSTNPQLVEIAALGPCSSLSPATFIVVSELTTVGAVWALSPFMTDATHIGTSATNAVGLQNAFLSAGQLANTVVAGGTGTVPGAVTAPVAELNTLANILAACVNTAGGAAGDSTPCGKLMSAATPSGGTAPTDIVGAALGVTQHPGLNVSALYGLVTTNGPFQPTLAAAPNDWTVTLVSATKPQNVGGGYLSIAIDAAQKIWVGYGTGISNTHPTENSGVLAYGQDLALVSPAAGYTDPSLHGVYALAFDLSGNLWVANVNAFNLTEFSGTGNFIRSVMGGGLSGPGFVAVDPSNNIWATNFGGYYVGTTYTDHPSGVSEFRNDGAPLSPSTGYTGGGAGNYQIAVAIDSTGNAWIAGSTGLAKLGPGGTAISPSSTYGSDTGNALAIDGDGSIWAPLNAAIAKFSSGGVELSPTGGFTGGGLEGSFGVAVDGVGHIWAVNADGYNQPVHVGTLSEFGGAGVPLSGATGYAATPGGALGLSIDGSGNIWWPGLGKLYKCVGCAAPVVTPIAVATATGKLGARP